MMKDAFDVTVVVNAHREGLIAAATLKSLRRSRLYAERHGYRVETIICLDKGDELTRELIHNCASEDSKLLEVNFGDLGQSRNFAVTHALGRYISFLDADDLFGENWLAFAIKAADGNLREVIWHPEVNLYFGLDPHILRHIDMEIDEFEPLSMILGNPWTALSFAKRAVFERFPYPETSLSMGIGYEDWGWNRRVMSAGFIHKTVKGTGHAIRQKAVSLVKQTTAAGVLPAGTDLFRKILEKRAATQKFRHAIEPLGNRTGAKVAPEFSDF